MSQAQQQRPQSDQEPIKYGDVFPVSGELADKPVSPQDASLMQSAENTLLGQTQKGGVAATMQSAARYNERAGVVGHTDVTDIARDVGMTVAETDVPGGRIVAEALGGQVVGTFVLPTQQTQGQGQGQGQGQDQGRTTASSPPVAHDTITIGEALEVTALIAGDKPVDQSDAAAIQAAEVRATGSNVMTPGGVAAMAQSAARVNAQMVRDKDKTKLGDILTDATVKLPADKPATRQDAEGVMGAELRNNPKLATHPGGVAASVVAAARLNQGIK